MVQVSETSHLVNSNGSKSPVKIWLFETNHRIAGPWGSLSETRIALRHYMERQLGLKIHPSTARRTTDFAAVTVSACTCLMFNAKGAFDVRWYFLECGLSERDPHGPCSVIVKELKCYNPILDDRMSSSFSTNCPSQ
ncbi:MAG: hypothetical protein ISS66_02300 [Desulfobacteraceae bacterium]|nr:hypothetical protein [Desulfobacteraceae bacterium]